MRHTVSSILGLKIRWWALSAVMLLLACKAEDGPIKIACVGDSITYGMKVVNREKNAYPAQLQEMLGDAYRVENFGISSRTLTKKGNHPYWNEAIYKKALDFNADIVFIKLGSNDAKQINRKHLNAFEQDYKDLVESFKKNNPNARVVLLHPIPSFHTDSTYIFEPVITKQIISQIQKVAYDLNVESVDLHQLFIDKPNLLPDSIHPSSLGMTLIARRLYETVVQKNHHSEEENSLYGNDTTESNFHGYQQIDFKYNSVACKIVKPKRVAKGKPWVLRARFWGHEPQTDVALLERGFHIAYCDVANLYGAEEAVNRWNAFYELMVANGFSKKVALEGMSRGGLIMYNWSVKNPEKVACVYADAPVLDGKSWPKGDGIYRGSTPDWERFKQSYGLTSDSLVAAFQGDPIHKTKQIASAGFPMLHVCGLTDIIVPVDENTKPFATSVKNHGGNIETIYKDNNGHHPHSLKNPELIVNFILRATNQKINLAVVPAAGAEYRSGAGWKKDKDWWAQAKDIDSMCMAADNLDVLFIGNSITQGLSVNRPNVAYFPGKAAVQKNLSNYTTIGTGISGDRTQNVLWRLTRGHYEKANPKYIAITIGVNNFLNNDSAEEIAEGIKKIVEVSLEKFGSDTQILLFGPLPTGLKPDSWRRKKYQKIHDLIKPLGDLEQVEYCNMLDQFTDIEGHLNMEIYGNDGIHLKSKGYAVWTTFIRNKIKELN